MIKFGVATKLYENICRFTRVVVPAFTTYFQLRASSITNDLVSNRGMWFKNTHLTNFEKSSVTENTVEQTLTRSFETL